MTRAEALEIRGAEALLNGRCVGHVENGGAAGTVLVMDWHDPAGCEHFDDDDHGAGCDGPLNCVCS